MDLSTDELLQVAWDLAEADRQYMSADLEQRVMALAVAGARPLQHPGWLQPDLPQISSLDAFSKTAAVLGALVEGLSSDDWRAATQLAGVSVHQLVVHLVGVERYVLGQLSCRARLDAPRREDHWPVTALAAAELLSEPPELVAQSWWQEALRVIAACGELGPDYEVSYHHLSGSARGLLVIRIFELWTHGDDIRRATHRQLDELDEARLALMVNGLMDVLPLGLVLCGHPQPGRSARFDLSGSGGGVFDVPLSPDQEAGEPDVTLVMPAIDLCRYASNRLSSEKLDVIADGEASLLEPILAGVSAFAAD